MNVQLGVQYKYGKHRSLESCQSSLKLKSSEQTTISISVNVEIYTIKFSKVIGHNCSVLGQTTRASSFRINCGAFLAVLF